MVFNKFFNGPCRIFLLLLPLIFAFLETNAETSVPLLKTTTEIQQDSEKSWHKQLNLPFQELMQSIQKMIHLKEPILDYLKLQKNDDTNSEMKRSEGVTFSLYDYDNKYKETFPENTYKN